MDWFRIHFLENNGMAWGKEFGGKSGKLFLSLFRLAAITGIGYWLYGAVRNKMSNVLIVAIALIFAGALGNIIDSIFYGVFLVIVIGKLLYSYRMKEDMRRFFMER
jgi:signal peptidase II